jgi:hypothetical protein
MTTITVFGRVLTANREERTITGLMLPFGEVGHTSAGKITAGAGAVRFPASPDSVHLNIEHDSIRPVGKGISFEEKEDGIHASFRVAKTTTGDDLLTEVEEGLRASLSVEVSNPVIRDGVLIGGDLTGCGAVVKPAFPSAAIYQMTAADCGGTTTEQKDETMGTLPENTAPGSVSGVTVPPVITAADIRQEVGNILHAAFNAGGANAMNAVMTAALADLTTDTGKLYVGDQQLGELWTARKAARPLIEAVGVKALTSLVQVGKKINRTFVVDDWAGGKVELPTATFTTSQVTWNAAAKAVAVDVAAELIEFGGEGVITELYAQALDSYITQTEDEFVAYLLAQATLVSAVTTSAVAVIDKGSEVLGDIGANMDFIVVAPNVMSFLRSVTSANAPWWLANQGAVDLRNRSLNMGGLTLVSNSSLAAGEILMGDSRAIDYREGRDIKFRALDVAHGGVDISFIKFRSQKVLDTGAVIKFTGVTGA